MHGTNLSKGKFNLVIEHYFRGLREQLQSLDKAFLTNPTLREELNKQLLIFFDTQVADFVQQYVPRLTHKTKTIVQITGYKKILREIIRPFKRLTKKYFRFLFPQIPPYLKIDLLEALISLTDEEIKKLAEVLFNEDKWTKLNQHIIDFQNIKTKKCLFITPVFPTTWNPMLTSLKKRGWTSTCLLQYDLKATDGYGCLSTKEIDADYIFFFNFLEVIFFLTYVETDPIFFSGEAYHSPNWNSVNTLLMFLNLSVILTTVKHFRLSSATNLILIMYDGIKPVSKFNELFKADLSIFYQKLMSLPDKIIYNSNTERLGNFVENAYGIRVPRLHFYRHSASLSQNRKPRRSFGKNNDEFHVVSITSFCNRECCASRSDSHEAVKAMLEQGIHFHYYTNDFKENIEWFKSTLTKECRNLFHVYPVNRDQQWLVDELHQYHAGFNGSDFFPFAQGISNMNDKLYREGMLNFMLSTFGTSFHVYAAAGIPPILPGMCTDSAKYYEGFCIPMNISEFKNAKEFFKTINLVELCQNFEKYYKKATIEEHIHKLVDFIEL